MQWYYHGRLVLRMIAGKPRWTSLHLFETAILIMLKDFSKDMHPFPSAESERIHQETNQNKGL